MDNKTRGHSWKISKAQSTVQLDSRKYFFSERVESTEQLNEIRNQGKLQS